MYYRQPHPAATDPPDNIAANARKLDDVIAQQREIIKQNSDIRHALALTLKGIHQLMTTFADVKTEIDNNIQNQNAFIAAATGFQTAAQALIQQLEAGNDFQGALDELKAQDGTLTTQTQQITASVGTLGQTAASVATGVTPGSSPADPTAPVSSAAPVSSGDGSSSASSAASSASATDGSSSASVAPVGNTGSSATNVPPASI